MNFYEKAMLYFCFSVTAGIWIVAMYNLITATLEAL